MILLLRGLPGSGKSAIARALAPYLNAVVLNKDEVRAALFPGSTTEYSTAQDDFVIGLMLEAARWHLNKERTVILDGRTYTRLSQIEPIRRFAFETKTPLHVLECSCDEATALNRIQADFAAGTHPARDRTPALYHRQSARWEPLQGPVCRIDTTQPIHQSVAQILTWLHHPE